MPPREHDFADAHRLAHLLWEVSARTSSLTEAALSELPLSPASAGVLELVDAKPGVSIAEMARWLPTSPQGLSQIVSRLERLGYLERRLGARGYGIALFLTKAGARAHEQANQRLAQTDLELVAALGQEEHDELVRLLDHARSVLEQRATGPDPSAATRT